jgi:hypothetical protein
MLSVQDYSRDGLRCMHALICGFHINANTEHMPWFRGFASARTFHRRSRLTKLRIVVSY